MDDNVIASVVEVLFPPGSALAPSFRDVRPAARFYVIPGQFGPRWIVPHDPCSALTYLQQSPPYSRWSKMKWVGLMAAYRTGSLDLMPGIRTIGITIADPKSWAHLGWTERHEPIPIVYVGTPGATRKAVAALFSSERRRLTGIAKVPLAEGAMNAIRAESATLRVLAEERPGLAPGLLWADPLRGVAVQEAVAGARAGTTLTEAHVDWLAGLRLPGESLSLRSVADAMHSWMSAAGGDALAIISSLQRVLAAIDDPTPLPAVWTHGDFAPWNLKCDSAGAMRAVDWEQAERKGLPLFDLVYHQAQLSYLLGRSAALTTLARWASRYLDYLGIANGQLPRIVTACFALDTWRWWRIGHAGRATFSLSHAIRWAEACM